MRCVREFVTCALFTLLACNPGPGGPSQPQPGADAKVEEAPAGEPKKTPTGTPELPEGVVVEPTPSPGSTPGSGDPKPADGAVVQCTPETRKGGVCTREFRQVCGTLADKTTKSYSNPCVACSDTNVVSYVEGECAGGSKEQAK